MIFMYTVSEKEGLRSKYVARYSDYDSCNNIGECNKEDHDLLSIYERDENNLGMWIADISCEKYAELFMKSLAKKENLQLEKEKT